MVQLRPRESRAFSGFTEAEIEKMEKVLMEAGQNPLNEDTCQKLARSFSRSAGRAGKPVVKWRQIQSWFQDKQQELGAKVPSLAIVPKESIDLPNALDSNNQPEGSFERPKDEKIPDLSELEFEARSSKDGAWYDVAVFLTHRVLSSGELEVRVRFVGFGAEEDEWVNVKKAVRERSIPLEPSECQMVKIGDLVLCFQERKDQAIYYDARVLEIQRKLHDIRGCRCLFLVRYDHDSTEERVRLRRLCRRPTY